MPRPGTLAVAAFAALAVAAPMPARASAAERLRPANAPGPLGSELLSDERTLSRWAHPYQRAIIRKRPAADAARVTRLRHRTEDGLSEVYLVLRSRVDADGMTWLQLRVPMRPNGTTGWVPRDAMSGLEVVRTHLIVNRRSLRATLHDRGRRVWSARVGVGKAGTPTPPGKFWIRERLRGDGKVYGTWALGTGAYSVLSDWPGGGVIGIHGTNQPGLIPGRPSSGCIRLRNRKINQLVRLAPIGTPVEIS